jgi:hypothetical protein
MWILDAYELLRTIDGTIRAGMWHPRDPLGEQFNRAKRSIADIRVPLAKFEPAGRSGKAVAGDAVPFPVFVPGRGAGWVVGQDVAIVTRGDFGDQILALLETATMAGSPPAAS